MFPLNMVLFRSSVSLPEGTVLAVFPDGLNQTRKGAPRHIFFHSDFGVANSFCDAVTFKAFYEAVKPMHGEIKRSCSPTDCMDTCVYVYMCIYI